MKINLSERIRLLRKERGMTQEQLAEALGVTAGAIYKWETGRSVPELGTIVEMADLFETSVDALLDYQMRSNDYKHTLERLKAARHAQPDADALADAERALRKYPNHFDVVYYSATSYAIAAVTHENDRWARRALELLQHALVLIDQNTDEKISGLSIRIRMAELYSSLQEQEKSLELLKANNPMGVNDAQIGRILAELKQSDEALTYLSDGLIDVMVQQFRLADGYLNAYEQKGDTDAQMEMTQWILTSLRSLKEPGTTSFLDRMEAYYLAVLAHLTLKNGKEAEAVQILRQARQAALRFDAEPDTSLRRLRFVNAAEQSTAYDNMGASALDGIRIVLKQQNSAALTALWEEIEHETQ